MGSDERVDGCWVRSFVGGNLGGLLQDVAELVAIVLALPVTAQYYIKGSNSYSDALKRFTGRSEEWCDML